MGNIIVFKQVKESKHLNRMDVLNKLYQDERVALKSLNHVFTEDDLAKLVGSFIQEIQ